VRCLSLGRGNEHAECAEAQDCQRQYAFT
jgi:hypothetical protein